jgi:ATP-dependent DNA ligase
MAKRMDGRYLPGRRSRLWLKTLRTAPLPVEADETTHNAYDDADR